jgi:DNA-binding IclR family transcriptional regulator
MATDLHAKGPGKAGERMQGARAGIKAIEVGGRLLRVLLRAPEMSLKELAAAARMSPSKAHRYLASFIEIGLVSQDPKSRHYALGNLAFELGLAALKSHQPLRSAAALVVGLRDLFDETFLLSVWGTSGPTIVQISESSRPIVMTMRVGATLPLSASATGFVFSAHLPSRAMGPEPDQQADDASVELFHAKVRREGYAYNDGRLMPGVGAIAVPLFEPTGALLAVVAAIGPCERIAPDVRPELVAGMKRAADAF